MKNTTTQCSNESLVLGAIIEQGGQNLPPHCTFLIKNAPESFDDQRHGAVALAIRGQIRDGKPVHAVSVAQAVKFDDAIAFVSQLLASAEMISTAEAEAIELCDAFKKRQTRQTLTEAAQAAQDYPEQSVVIAEHTIKTLESIAGSSTSIANQLAAVRFDIHAEPSRQTAVFTLQDGTTTHTRGNISALNAQPKAGKTALVAALIAAAIAENQDDCDLLGFRAVNPDRRPVLLLDTEHSPEHHWKLCDRILRRAKLIKSDLLHAYRLTGFNVNDVNAALKLLLAEREWFAVFLDGTGDFVSDVNDAEECNALLTRLHGQAITHDTQILNVLHFNPSSDSKSRGHLGSQLERKAETNLCIQKTEGISVVYAEKNRGADIPKQTGPRFVWSQEHQMHVSIANHRKSKEEAEKQDLRVEAEAVFTAANKSVISYGQFVIILEREVHVSQSTAKRHFNEMIRTQIVRKELTGHYTLSA